MSSHLKQRVRVRLVICYTLFTRLNHNASLTHTFTATSTSLYTCLTQHTNTPINSYVFTSQAACESQVGYLTYPIYPSQSQHLSNTYFHSHKHFSLHLSNTQTLVTRMSSHLKQRVRIRLVVCHNILTHLHHNTSLTHTFTVTNTHSLTPTNIPLSYLLHFSDTPTIRRIQLPYLLQYLQSY